MAVDSSPSIPSGANTFEAAYQGKESMAGEIRQKYWDGVQGLRTEMRDYWLNHAFLHGYQWLYWSEHNGRLDEMPTDPERVQATVNRLWPNTRTIISTLMQRELSFEVPPNAADDSHMRGARLAETIARAVHHDHNWENIRENMYYAVWKGGTAAMCVDWDDTSVEILSDDTQGTSPLGEGDTYEEWLNITQFVVEPGVREPEKARYWIKAVALPPTEVKAMFPDVWEDDDIPPADATAGLAPFHRKLMSYDRGGDSDLTALTLVMTYYERPNNECPEGKVVRVVDQKIVFESEWPFPFKNKLNLVVVRETLRENRWTGDTVLTAARPIQTLLNVSWSSIAEHMKLAGNARLLVPMSSIEMMQSLTDLPGEVVPYNDSAQMKPEYLSPPQMPGWWIQQPDKLANEIDDIMGVHDISRGSAPANIESGFGLTILAEKDNTPVNRLTKEASGAFGRLMSLVLEIYEDKTMTGAKRKSTVSIPGNAPIDVRWSGKDLRGQTTARVPQDAILPRSRAAQMEMAKDMLASGLIENITDFIAIADLPGSRDILTVTSPDVDRARRENSHFGVGRQALPYPWDKHDVHIAEHNKYRKTIDFDMLSDEDKKMIEEHIKAHEVLAAEEIGSQRMKSNLDPALGMAPNADEAPPLEALPAGPPMAPVGGGPVPMGPAGQEALSGPGLGGEVTPEQGASEIMSLMSQMGQ
tara:strand:+ start:361 stop:2457 length:2097 start_codon:yes stop_codon:yes gene_type:complete